MNFKLWLENDYAWSGNRFPPLLKGLAAEARKAGSFEEFEKDYTRQIKHGLYWHWTDDPHFRIDPNKGPQDMSSIGSGEVDKGKLMITSHLEYWSDYGKGGKGRPFAAMIDMSNVPRNQYYQVNRGFGNEFWVNDPSKASVIKVVPRQRAFRIDREHHKLIPQSQEALQDFYNFVVNPPAYQPAMPQQS